LTRQVPTLGHSDRSEGGGYDEFGWRLFAWAACFGVMVGQRVSSSIFTSSRIALRKNEHPASMDREGVKGEKRSECFPATPPDSQREGPSEKQCKKTRENLSNIFDLYLRFDR